MQTGCMLDLHLRRVSYNRAIRQAGMERRTHSGQQHSFAVRIILLASNLSCLPALYIQ